MFIFYKISDGVILSTLDGDIDASNLIDAETDFIEIPSTVIDFSCFKVVNGELKMFTLEPIREKYLVKVGAEISITRSQFITDLAGQDMIYLRKEQEAISYVSAAAPVLSDYPMIQAEVGITAPSGYEVAQIWLYMSQMWQIFASQLEAIRLTATNAIASATTEAEIITAFQTFETSLSTFSI
jgi:hypothetical protein